MVALNDSVNLSIAFASSGDLFSGHPSLMSQFYYQSDLPVKCQAAQIPPELPPMQTSAHLLPVVKHFAKTLFWYPVGKSPSTTPTHCHKAVVQVCYHRDA